MTLTPGAFRVKSRSGPPTIKIAPSTIEKYNGAPTGVVISNNPVTTDSGLAEKIAYTTRVKGKPLASNWCVHVKERTWYSGNVTDGYHLQFDPPNLYSYDVFWNHHESSFAHEVAVIAARAALPINLGKAVLGAGGQAYINTATLRLRPDLTTVSIPNFILELKDIRRMFTLFKSNLSLAKNVAGAHLNYKFGWKPFIGDLQNIYNGVAKLHDRLVAWEKSINVLQHGSTTLLKDSTTISGSSPAGFHSVAWTLTVTRHVKAHIKWKPLPLAIMQPFEKTLRALMDALGFELNPRIVWNALPFSFVLDWFFDVGSFLERFNIDALELPIVYIDSALDYKEVIKIESTYQGTGMNWIPRTFRSPSWVTMSTYYQRMPIFADYLTLSGLGGRVPTLDQSTLLLSLGVVLGGRR